LDKSNFSATKENFDNCLSSMKTGVYIYLSGVLHFDCCVQINNQDKKGSGFMVFNATFNNISVISWWSVLLVEETRVPGDNHCPDKFYHQKSI
jgi:hypothetical protein